MVATTDLADRIREALGDSQPVVTEEIICELKELEQEAYINPVTKYPDGRQLGKDLVQITKEYARRKSDSQMKEDNIYVLLIDIDNFGDFNKRYDMETGDTVLKTVNSIIHQTFRDDDIVLNIANQRYDYHLHGEEMLALYTCENLSDALKVAERVRISVKEKSQKLTGYQVTISLGITKYNTTSEEFAAAQARADEYMQVAKQEGRDRTYCGENDPLFRYKKELYQPGIADAFAKKLAGSIRQFKGTLGRTATKTLNYIVKKS